MILIFTSLIASLTVKACFLILLFISNPQINIFRKVKLDLNFVALFYFIFLSIFIENFSFLEFHSISSYSPHNQKSNDGYNNESYDNQADADFDLHF